MGSPSRMVKVGSLNDGEDEDTFKNGEKTQSMDEVKVEEETQ